MGKFLAYTQYIKCHPERDSYRVDSDTDERVVNKMRQFKTDAYTPLLMLNHVVQYR